MWGCVSLLLNMHKKRISTEYSPKDAPYNQPATVPVATNTLHICSNGHPAVPAQEALHGVQAV
jgi:hypothetical protein